MSEKVQGMASEPQIKKIKELTASPDFKIPLASFLKSITCGKAQSIDELTSSQAADVIGAFKKLVK